jgi:nitrite reductase (NADH) large subunit
LLFDIGDPPKQVTFEEMSLDTQICNCNGVSKGALMFCVESGKRSPKAVMDATRAGMGCGSLQDDGSRDCRMGLRR